MDQAKLEALMGQTVSDLAAAATAALVVLGDKLGLYKALAQAGPTSSADLARSTNTSERYVREWLAAQAAAGYIDYHAETGRYELQPEQAAVFTQEGGPAFLVGAFEAVSGLFHDEPKLTDAFRSGEGVPWGDHHPCIFRGTERLTSGGYQAQLVPWIASIEGLVERLAPTARRRSRGCGFPRC